MLEEEAKERQRLEQLADTKDKETGEVDDKTSDSDLEGRTGIVLTQTGDIPSSGFVTIKKDLRDAGTSGFRAENNNPDTDELSSSVTIQLIQLA